MKKIYTTLNSAAALLLLFLIPVMFSCKQNSGDKQNPEKRELSEQEKEAMIERSIEEGSLTEKLKNKNFEQALSNIASLHLKYPHDPQLYFYEGWVYDMKEDSIKSHIAFSKALNIYDSLIVAKTNFVNEINRAVIVQILYGQEAYTKALDKIQAKYNTYNDSLEIEMVWRKFVYNPNEFFQESPTTSSVN